MYPACILHLRYVTLRIHLRYMYLIICIPYVSRMYPPCILEPLQIHVSHMYLACIPHVSHVYLSCILCAFLLAGVPTLQQLQGRAKEMKRARTAAVHLDQLIDLKNLALTYFQPMPEPLTLMPPSGTQLAAQQTDAAALPDPTSRKTSQGAFRFSVLNTWSLTRATKRRSALSSLGNRANRTSPRYVKDKYPKCICSVSRMYLVCIQPGSDEASKIHVS
jgi:hypothetical protein